MNPGFVACMLVAIAVGATAAGMVLVAGWGLIAAFVLYSLVGSFTLVATAMTTLPGVPVRRARRSERTAYST